MVLAADGRRMSKSLGTGLDPLDLIAEHGADATRYGLLKMSSSAGRPFRDRRDRGGAEAREQALEREPPRCSARRVTQARSSTPDAVEERWIFARLD